MLIVHLFNGLKGTGGLAHARVAAFNGDPASLAHNNTCLLCKFTLKSPKYAKTAVVTHIPIIWEQLKFQVRFVLLILTAGPYFITVEWKT